MVRTFCDRCGRGISGMSQRESVTIAVAGAQGEEIAKLDYCTYCADWAINTLMHRTMLGAGEKKGAPVREMDKLEFDLTHGALRPKDAGAQANAGRERLKQTAKRIREADAKTAAALPKLNVRGSGAGEKKQIFAKLLRYKEHAGIGWAGRISEASKNEVSRETVRAIVTDGLTVDISVWRVIERAVDDLECIERAGA